MRSAHGSVTRPRTGVKAMVYPFPAAGARPVAVSDSFPDLDAECDLRAWRSMAALHEAHQLGLSALLSRDSVPLEVARHLSALVYAAAVAARRAHERAAEFDSLLACGGAA